MPKELLIALAAIAVIACVFVALANGGDPGEPSDIAYVAPAATASQTPTTAPTMTPSPTPTPSPTAERVVYVHANGDGDYATLAEAVTHARTGDTIVLTPGSYTLDEPLDIIHRITLRGAGTDLTEVVSEAQGYAVYLGADGTEVEGIAFRHEGSGWAVVVWSDADVSINHCRFSGGEWNQKSMRGGAGLGLYGSASATVTDSEASGNDLQGIVVMDSASPLLARVRLIHNVDAGIVFLDSAGGEARDCDCSGNDGAGIVVADESSPSLAGNTCNHNGGSGFLFADSATGTADSNQCTGNGVDGITVMGDASPRLEGNTCDGNVQNGVAYFDTASGLAVGNSFSRNGYYGVMLSDYARPTLEHNEINGNASWGLAYFGSSGGTAEGNECAHNSYDGIYVAASSLVLLMNNNCHDNGWEDVYDEREDGESPVYSRPTPVATATRRPSSLTPTGTPTPTQAPPPGYGLITFQNPMGAELNITFTRREDGLAATWKVSKSEEEAAFLTPTGTWTYTIDAPPPYESINGEMTVEEGQSYTIVASIPRTPGQ